MAPILGYWSLRGFAEPIRYLLHHVGQDYEEKLYTIGPDPPTCRDEWLKDKFNLGLPCPNLPYYIDGDLKLVESHAIARHLGRKHGLAGKTEKDFTTIDMAASILKDLYMDYGKMAYSGSNFESAKATFLGAVAEKIQKLVEIVGAGNFILGDQISWVDFWLLELQERYLLLMPSCFDDKPTLKAYHARMLALPGVAKYRQSSQFKLIETRFNGRFAAMGGGVY